MQEQVVSVTHPRHGGSTMSVCVCKDSPHGELSDLLGSMFKTGARPVLGFEELGGHGAVLALQVAVQMPQLLRPSPARYGLMLGQAPELDEVSMNLIKFVSRLFGSGHVSRAAAGQLVRLARGGDSVLRTAYAYCALRRDTPTLARMLKYVGELGAGARKQLQQRLVAVSDLCAADALTQGDGGAAHRLLLVGNGAVGDVFGAFEIDGDGGELIDAIRRVVDMYDLENGAGQGPHAPPRPAAPEPAKQALIRATERLAEQGMISRAEAEKLRQLISQEDEYVMAAFEVLEEDGDMEELLDTLVRIARLHSGMTDLANMGGDSYASDRGQNGFGTLELGQGQGADPSQDAFLGTVATMVRDGLLSSPDAAWLRGRRAAGDKALAGAQKQIVGGVSSPAEVMGELLRAATHFRRMRAQKGLELEQLVESMSDGSGAGAGVSLTEEEAGRLQKLVSTNNEVVLSAYEVFAVELDVNELFETLAMVVRLPGLAEAMGREDPDLINDAQLRQEASQVASIMSALATEQRVPPALARAVSNLALNVTHPEHDAVLAAFDVYAVTDDVDDLVDTLARVVHRLGTSSGAQGAQGGGNDATASAASHSESQAQMQRYLATVIAQMRARGAIGEDEASVLLVAVADLEASVVAAWQMHCCSPTQAAAAAAATTTQTTVDLTLGEGVATTGAELVGLEGTLTEVGKELLERQKSTMSPAAVALLELLDANTNAMASSSSTATSMTATMTTAAAGDDVDATSSSSSVAPELALAKMLAAMPSSYFTALRLLVLCSDSHVEAAFDVWSVDHSDEDFADTLARIAARAAAGRAPYDTPGFRLAAESTPSVETQLQQGSPQLSSSSSSFSSTTTSGSDAERAILLEGMRRVVAPSATRGSGSEPTPFGDEERAALLLVVTGSGGAGSDAAVRAALEVFSLMPNIDELADTLAAIAETRARENAIALDAVTGALFGGGGSDVSMTSASGGRDESKGNVDVLTRGVAKLSDMDRATAALLEQDLLSHTQLQAVRGAYAKGDPMVTAALEVLRMDGDVQELSDTLQTILQVRAQEKVAPASAAARPPNVVM